MRTTLKLAGSYWQHYPVPGSMQRCMAPRTVEQAFGPGAAIQVPPRRPRLRVVGVLVRLCRL